MRKFEVFVSITETAIREGVWEYAIKPLRKANFDVFNYITRPVTRPFSEGIHDYIVHCNVVIAVISGLNPNVMYEVGLAIGNGKPIIPVTDSVRNCRRCCEITLQSSMTPKGPTGKK